MKKILIFITGIILGILLTVISIKIVNNEKMSKDNPQYFEIPGECITKNTLEVFQDLGDGFALAHELEDTGLKYGLKKSGMLLPTDLTVLIFNSEGKPYYDNQKIKIPKDKCARQIGIYKYTTKNNFEKTVPIVEIME